jgi:hypothetical protein
MFSSHQNTQGKRQSYPHDIHGIIDKHEKVFGKIPQDNHYIGDLSTS